MLIETQQLTEQLDLFMCIQCGKCTGGCPIARKAGFNLRMLIYQILIADSYELGAGDMLWDCTTCQTCSLRCPKDVHPSELIIALRSLMIEGGKVPRTLSTALTSVFRNGNPWELSRANRADWSTDLPIRNALEEPVEVLYYAGCTPSYDPRAQKVARAIVTVLDRANITVGTLGTQETCCGSEIRRAGEMGLFEMLVEDGSALLKAAQAQHMITTSPHCFDAFTHHYENPGYPVEHYTQYLARLIADRRLTFTREAKRRVTYHDPCYLGKQNKIFDEPRAILRSIPGLEFAEMDRSRETSLCCEGGGGRMWCEGVNPDVRLANERIMEALDTGAQVLATACPFCLTMLEDAAKQQNVDDQIDVRDIVELVAEAL